MVDLSDPFRSAEPGVALRENVREALDRVVALVTERQRGRAPALPDAIGAPLPSGRRIACTSLVGGCGTTTVAALIAQRGGGAGARVRLVDADLIAPTLALLAGSRLPSLGDALLSSEVRGRRWGSVEVVFGALQPLEAESGPAIAAMLRRLARDAALVVDAGALPSCPPELLGAQDVLIYVTTPRPAHLVGALRAGAWLAAVGTEARLVVNRADPEIAAAVAAEAGLALLGHVPEDPYLARDEFRIRAETARAVDALCASLAA